MSWGCDAPAQTPVFGITCPRCDGGDTECELCGGRGDLYQYRCPSSQVTRSTAALLRAWGAYQNGVLPDPGGMYDQSACFIHALSVLSAEKAAIEELERSK